MRKLLKPTCTTDQILTILKSNHFEPGSDVKIKRELESYDDQNFLVEVDGQKKYLAKVHNGVESEHFIRVSSEIEKHDKVDPESYRGCAIHLQKSICAHLSDPKYGIASSVTIPPPGNSKDDKTTSATDSIQSLPVLSPSHSPYPLVIRVMSWVPGIPLSSTMPPQRAFPSIETFADVGAYLGRIRLALDELTEKDPIAREAATRRGFMWDVRNVPSVRAFYRCIKNVEKRKLVESVVDTFIAKLEGLRDLSASEAAEKSGFKIGILQGDFNDANIIINDHGQVSGVIDFGDSALSWSILDLAVAMTYSMVSNYGKSRRSLSAAAAVLRGYCTVNPITDFEREHLRLLMACRLVTSVTLGAYSYEQNPENTYLLLHAEPAWNALGLIWGDSKLANPIDQLFWVASQVGAGDTAETAKKSIGLIDCSDINFPDPGIPDVFSAVRTSSDSIHVPSSSSSSGPPLKRHKNEEETLPVLTFVTGNKKKLEEVKRILMTTEDEATNLKSKFPFVLSNRKIDLPELQGEDPLEIAKEKCALAAKEMGGSGAVIIEDTSLCFHALHGLPGPYIKWFLDKCGHDGLNDMIGFSEDKSAYAQTVVAFTNGPGEEIVTFDGRTNGKIVRARGPLNFGWDPIFEPDEGGGLTYAEMTKDAKDSISHRSRAFAQLKTYLLTRGASKV